MLVALVSCRRVSQCFSSWRPTAEDGRQHLTEASCFRANVGGGRAAQANLLQAPDGCLHTNVSKLVAAASAEGSGSCCLCRVLDRMLGKDAARPAYYNYQTSQVEDYEAAYWGPNYARLQQVGGVASVQCKAKSLPASLTAVRGAAGCHCDLCSRLPAVGAGVRLQWTALTRLSVGFGVWAQGFAACHQHGTKRNAADLLACCCCTCTQCPS